MFGQDRDVDSAASFPIATLFWSVRAGLAAARGVGAERARGESRREADVAAGEDEDEAEDEEDDATEALPLARARSPALEGRE
jgi:hypothetical protein